MCFCIWLGCEYLQCVSVFGWDLSICNVFLFGWDEYLQCVSVFGWDVSICNVFLYLVGI